MWDSRLLLDTSVALLVPWEELHHVTPHPPQRCPTETLRWPCQPETTLPSGAHITRYILTTSRPQFMQPHTTCLPVTIWRKYRNLVGCCHDLHLIWWGTHLRVSVENWLVRFQKNLDETTSQIRRWYLVKYHRIHLLFLMFSSKLH